MTADADAIASAGRWRVTLVEVGASIHPGEWIAPGYPEWAWSPINVVVLRSPEQTSTRSKRPIGEHCC